MGGMCSICTIHKKLQWDAKDYLVVCIGVCEEYEHVSMCDYHYLYIKYKSLTLIWLIIKSRNVSPSQISTADLHKGRKASSV